ncbi:hypothetical protein LXL04_004008 [Taraxacum kok-saghyz]
MAAQEEGDSPQNPKRVVTGARVGTRSHTGSPMSEKHGNGGAPLTPGRSRLRQVTLGDETPDEGTAVPVFGDWDDSDPASAEGYSHIFNKVREEKHGGGGVGGKSPRMNTDDSSFYGQRHDPKKGQGCGCFPWGKK